MILVRLSLLFVCGICLLIGTVSVAVAQQNQCPASVYYGSIGAAKGQNIGQCQTAEQACATMDYALEQGQQICSQEVHIYYVDQNRDFEQSEWHPQTTPRQEFMDSIRVILPWLGSAFGLLAGWFAAINLRRLLEARQKEVS